MAVFRVNCRMAGEFEIVADSFEVEPGRDFAKFRREEKVIAYVNVDDLVLVCEVQPEMVGA